MRTRLGYCFGIEDPRKGLVSVGVCSQRRQKVALSAVGGPYDDRRVGSFWLLGADR
jgi:hypothetical protein